MPRAHRDHVEDQFGPQAAAYVESAVHSQGEDLDALEALVRRCAPRRALDIGAGGGHVSYRMAPHAGSVTACDLSAAMLSAVAETAKRKGLANIETVEAPAETLSLGSASFDFVASRFSTHHWHDWERGLREARRVAKAGAPAVFIDAFSPASALIDTHLQAVELLRDPSHVRDYSAAEWAGALTRSGFVIRGLRTWRLRMDFPTWVARMRTPPDNARMIRALQDGAAADIRSHFAIEPDGSFMLDAMMLETMAV